ncbi:MAG: CDP-alcohol phosphatidyltransferase family protein [Candidatus Auribacterota bacterium]|jgi:CDP-diacylglycerol--glycerol-3-phosphate 3-phosphatidyltransferase|nr:CDP-alcohol phosphatidyltransferase family protein [Candidatus Auribacterota bacterium]
MLNWANRITIFRLFCTPFLVYLLLRYREEYLESATQDTLEIIRIAVLIIFILAIVSDAVDGFIARVFKQKTLFGTILDPIADKLLLMSATVVLTFPIGLTYKIPYWLTVAIISRDIIILAGALLMFVLHSKTLFLPHYLGKITTFMQMSAIFFVLIEHPLCNVLFYITLLFTVLSGVNYVYREAKLVGSLGSDNLRK